MGESLDSSVAGWRIFFFFVLFCISFVFIETRDPEISESASMLGCQVESLLHLYWETARE